MNNQTQTQPMELRPYQAEARDAILREWDAGHRRTLLVLPTGCGKTVVFARVAEAQVRKGHQVLILAHRRELLTQAAEVLRRVTGLEAGLEMAGHSVFGGLTGPPGPAGSVTVGSVQTLARPQRLAAFPQDYFQDIIVDEAHHVLSKSYRRILNHFPAANVLGVTATPDRGDRKDLGRVFGSTAYEYSLPRAVRQGYLCPIRAEMIPLELDLSEVPLSSGDYSTGGIGSVLDPYLEEIAQKMHRYCAGRKTVVFLPLIRTAQKFCSLLLRQGLRAAEVHGGSPDRAQVLADFRDGRYDVLCNAMLLTEGWDCPAVDCIVVLRPTKLRSLYQQMVGRGMRPAPGKTELLLLDFLWLTKRHDLCTPSTLLPPEPGPENADGQADAAGPEAADGAEVEWEAEEAAEVVEDERDEEDQEEPEEVGRDTQGAREAALARDLSENRDLKGGPVDPIHFALSIAAEDLACYQPKSAWELLPPTEDQLAALARFGMDPAAVGSRGQASLLIGRLILRIEEGLCTPKQIRCLERFGFRQVGSWTFEAASHMIDRIARCSWRVPEDVTPKDYRPEAAWYGAAGQGKAG